MRGLWQLERIFISKVAVDIAFQIDFGYGLAMAEENTNQILQTAADAVLQAKMWHFAQNENGTRTQFNRDIAIAL